MKNTADQLRQAISLAEPLLYQITPEQASTSPQPGKWSAQEILGHLIDSACNNHQKFVRTIASPSVDFVGYAQESWVTVQQYAAAEWHALIQLWMAYNRHLAHLIEHVDPPALEHHLFIEGNGPFTLQYIMQDYVVHLTHHLAQILPEGPFESKFVNVYQQT